MVRKFRILFSRTIPVSEIGQINSFLGPSYLVGVIEATFFFSELGNLDRTLWTLGKHSPTKLYSRNKNYNVVPVIKVP